MILPPSEKYTFFHLIPFRNLCNYRFPKLSEHGLHWSLDNSKATFYLTPNQSSINLQNRRIQSNPLLCWTSWFTNQRTSNTWYSLNLKIIFQKQDSTINKLQVGYLNLLSNHLPIINKIVSSTNQSSWHPYLEQPTYAINHQSEEKRRQRISLSRPSTRRESFPRIPIDHKGKDRHTLPNVSTSHWTLVFPQERH